MSGVLEARRHPEHVHRPPDRLEELVMWHAAVRDACPRAQAALVNAFTNLVHKVAHRYATPGVEHDDLHAEGLAGFWHACERFDPARGFRLSTYATWWIRQRVGRAVERGAAIRWPNHVHDKLRRGALDRGRLPRVSRSLDEPISGADEGGRPRTLHALVRDGSADAVDPLTLLLLEEGDE